MTQAVINNLNNLQEMLAQDSANSRSVGMLDSAPFADFNKVLDKKMQVAESPLQSKGNIHQSQNIKENSTIANLKYSQSEGVGKTSLADLRSILTQAMKESKVENSLDLTLAKDVNEIINQLKDFIESTTEEGEIIIDETMLNKLGELIGFDDMQKMFDRLKDSFDDKESQMLFAQVAAVLNTKVPENTVLVEDIATVKEQINSMFKSTTLQAETAEKVTEAVAEKVTKTMEESVQKEVDSVLDDEMLKELRVVSLDSDSSMSDGGEFLMQNQTPEEQGLKAMLNQEVEAFDVSVNKAMNTQNSQSTQMKAADINPSKILDQVARQLEGLQSGSRVNIVLNPESLGKVNIHLMSTKDGLMAQFTVSTTEARDLLMKGLDGLKETLMAQGVSVDNVSVKLSESQKGEYNPDWTEQEGSNGGNKGQGQPNREEKEKGLFEKMMAETVQDENGNV